MIFIIVALANFNPRCPYRLSDIVKGYGAASNCACVQTTSLACTYVQLTKTHNDIKTLTQLVRNRLMAEPWLQEDSNVHVIHVRAGDGIIGPQCFENKNDCLITDAGQYSMSKSYFDKMEIKNADVCLIHVNTMHSTHHTNNLTHQRLYMTNVVDYFKLKCNTVVVKANINADDAFISMASARILFVTGGMFGKLAQKVQHLLNE